MTMGTEETNDDTALTDEAWRAETAAFKTPGVGGPTVSDIEGDDDAERNADGTFKAKAEEPEKKADAEDLDKAAQEEIEGKPGDLPKGVQARITRLNAKEEALNKREAAIKAMEEQAAKPKADDTKPEAKAVDLKLPAHIEQEEFMTAANFLIDSIPADVMADLRKMDPKAMNEDILVSMADEADGDKDKAADVADFVLASPAALKAINELPVRKRAAAFSKAYAAFATDKPAAATEPETKPKKSSDAPPPISRNGGASKSVNMDDFSSFEAARNAEDAEKGQRPY